MSTELDKERVSVLQSMMNVEVFPAMPELAAEMKDAAKIPLSKIATLGIAFQPMATAIQTAVSGSGGSGIYFVDTMGKKMFHASGSTEYIGSLMAPNGGVGGGQARMMALPCDPTMLFMAIALLGIEKKLDVIQRTQEEILQFLEEKERAAMQGNLNVLGEVMGNLKYNWNNEQYRTNKHILVQQIKKESESSIVLYREQIKKRLQKRVSIHGDLEVRTALKRLQVQFEDYQRALYLYAYSAFLEVMLLENFSEGYLGSVERSITEYAYQYRELYTDCYNLMESFSKTSIQSGVLNGLATVSKFMGTAISKVPVVRQGQLDENLIDIGNKLGIHGEKRVFGELRGLKQTRLDVTVPFVENIKTVNRLYNKPVRCFMDKENVYLQQVDEA